VYLREKGVNMLFRSTKSDTRPNHKHIIYVKKTEEGEFEAVVGEANGHTHSAVVNEDGTIELLSAGKAPHTHEIDDAITFNVEKTDDDDLTDTEKKSKFKRMKEEGEELEKKSIEKGKESEDFYAGNQWSDADKASLQADDRPAITINEIASKIDLLCGFQRQNRTDIRAFPVESGDNDLSQVATEAIKNVLDINNIQVIESEIFKDEISTGRGIYHHYVDYNDNMFGKIVLERLPWDSVHFGPHDKADLSDCEYIIKSAVIPKKKLKLMFSDKKDEINNLYARAEEIEYGRRNTTIEGLEYRLDNDGVSAIVDTKKQMITVTEIWEKNYLTAYSVVNFDDGFVDTVNELTERDITALESMGIEVIKRTIHNMRVTTCAGDIILDEKIEEQDFFPVVPIYAKRTSKGEFYGKIEDVKDIQREINKRHSQSLDIVNRVSSYGYYYDDQTFDSTREENQWKRDLSRAGWTAKVRDVGKLPAQTQGTKMPTELVGMTQLASEKLMTVMNISPETLGFSEREVSSVAIIEKRRNVLTANEFLFDNLAQGKRLVARNVLKMIQKVYSSDRLMRLISNQTPETEEQQAKVQKQQIAVERLLNDNGIDEIDIAVEISASSPTTRSANFSLLLEMVKYGLPVPPEVLIESSDLPNKDEIMGMITAQSQAAQASEQQKYDTEIQKTIIAKGGSAPQEAGVQGASLNPIQQQLMAQNQPQQF